MKSHQLLPAGKSKRDLYPSKNQKPSLDPERDGIYRLYGLPVALFLAHTLVVYLILMFLLSYAISNPEIKALHAVGVIALIPVFESLLFRFTLHFPRKATDIHAAIQVSKNFFGKSIAAACQFLGWHATGVGRGPRHEEYVLLADKSLGKSYKSIYDTVTLLRKACGPLNCLENLRMASLREGTHSHQRTIFLHTVLHNHFVFFRNISQCSRNALNAALYHNYDDCTHMCKQILKSLSNLQKANSVSMSYVKKAMKIQIVKKSPSTEDCFRMDYLETFRVMLAYYKIFEDHLTCLKDTYRKAGEMEDMRNKVKHLVGITEDIKCIIKEYLHSQETGFMLPSLSYKGTNCSVAPGRLSWAQ